jgi:hypothetical protein
MFSYSEKQQQPVNSSFQCQIVPSTKQITCTFDSVVFTTTLHEIMLLVVALTQLGKFVLPLIRQKLDKKDDSKICIKHRQRLIKKIEFKDDTKPHKKP